MTLSYYIEKDKPLEKGSAANISTIYFHPNPSPDLWSRILDTNFIFVSVVH